MLIKYRNSCVVVQTLSLVHHKGDDLIILNPAYVIRPCDVSARCCCWIFCSVSLFIQHADFRSKFKQHAASVDICSLRHHLRKQASKCLLNELQL